MLSKFLGLLKRQPLSTSSKQMSVKGEHFVLKGRQFTKPFPEGHKTVCFGTGCFWGGERAFWSVKGVHATSVGYIGGATDNPTYEQVCSGRTGHNEVSQVIYDPKKLSFYTLLKTFWECHDPTQGNRQGNDRGTQYRSGIYCTDAEQLEMAVKSGVMYSKALTKNGLNGKITTEIVGPPKKTPVYYLAEDYHQQYLAKPGSRQYCSAQPTGVDLPPMDEA